MSVVLVLLDGFLTVVHLVVVLGNLTLWFPRNTRKWHLALVTLTALSWLGLGMVYGLGYCFVTDWHWQVKRARGIEGLPGSFIQYVLANVLGIPISPETTNLLTVVGFALVAVLSIVLNLKDLLAKRSQRGAGR